MDVFKRIMANVAIVLVWIIALIISILEAIIGIVHFCVIVLTTIIVKHIGTREHANTWNTLLTSYEIRYDHVGSYLRESEIEV